MKYTPLRNYNRGTIDYSHRQDLLDIYNDYSNLNLNNFSFNTSEYQTTLDKLFVIISYIESLDYPNIINFKNLNINKIFNYNLILNGQIMYKFHKYQINQSNGQVIINIVTQFNYNLFLNLDPGYCNYYRGDCFNTLSDIIVREHKEVNTTNNYITNLYFGSNYNIIPILATLIRIDSSYFNLGCLNLPNLFINKTITKYPKCKGFTEFQIDNLKYIYPDEVVLLNNLTIKLRGYNWSSNNYNISEIHYNSTVDNYTFNSLYFLIISIQTKQIDFDCSMNINIDLPTNITIPSNNLTIQTLDTNHKLLFHGMFNMDNIIITNLSTKFIDTENKIFIYKSTSNDIFIIIYDDFGNETITDFSYTLLNGINGTYDVISKYIFSNYSLPNIFENYNNVMIYSFGNKIHTLLKTLNDLSIDFSKIYLYLEGMSAVTRNFQGFTENWNVINKQVTNLLYDNIANYNPRLNINQDDIKTNIVYTGNHSFYSIADIIISNCIHSPYYYYNSIYYNRTIEI